MTWTFAGTGGATPVPDGFVHNTATMPLTTHGTGNLVVCIATIHSVNTEVPTGFTSTTPNVTGWAKITSDVAGLANAGVSVTPSNWSGNVWAGTVSAVNTDSNLTPTYSSTLPSFVNFVTYEFHSTAGAWYLDSSAVLNAAAGTATWPSLTPSKAGGLYLGYAWNQASCSGGPTSPWVINTNADAASNGAAFNLNCAAGVAVTPNPAWTDGTETFGLMVMMLEGAASADSATAYAGSAADLGGGAGTWVTPANADGAPDGAYAAWAVP